jgi:hypothetical protein
MFGAVRKQEVGSAGGTQSNFRDIFRGNSSVQQLPAVRFGEIEKHLLRQLAVAGRSRGQKQQWIFLVNLIGFFGLAEERMGIGEL